MVNKFNLTSWEDFKELKKEDQNKFLTELIELKMKLKDAEAETRKIKAKVEPLDKILKEFLIRTGNGTADINYGDNKLVISNSITIDFTKYFWDRYKDIQDLEEIVKILSVLKPFIKVGQTATIESIDENGIPITDSKGSIKKSTYNIVDSLKSLNLYNEEDEIEYLRRFGKSLQMSKIVPLRKSELTKIKTKEVLHE